jgi:hypothetical protein
MERASLHAFFNELDTIHAPVVKEAGWGRDFLAWTKKRHRKAKQMAGKANDAVLTGSIKAYQAMPAPVQKAVNDPKIMDPSDQTGGIALGAAKRMLKFGAARRQKS